MRAGRMLRCAAVLSACVPLLDSCAGGGNGSAAPPTVICGRTVWNAPAGAVVEDVSAGGATVADASAGGYLFLRVSRGCARGVTLGLVPAGAARLVKDVTDGAGRSVAVVLDPAVPDFTVVPVRPDGGRRADRVRLPGRAAGSRRQP